MIVIFSGEGPADIGALRPKESGWEFIPGPMSWVVDRLLAQPGRLNYSVLELHANAGDCVCFLSEGELSDLRPSKPFFLPRGEDKDGNQYFRKGAYLLGIYATTVARDRKSSVVAVLFRDADGTRSTVRADWRRKFDSMARGFEAAKFPSGVPMVPRPKSEAWMLCGLLKHSDANANCHWLEDESGNDGSPNSLKRQLALHLGHEPTAEEQAELVRGGIINPERIDLSSFEAFREALDHAFTAAAAAP
jgi:hypothetical protein